MIKRTFLLFTLLFTQLHANIFYHSQENSYPQRWFPGVRANTGAYYHNDLDFFWQGDLFLPAFWSRNSLVFIDLRCIDYKGSSFEGNVGLGFRRLFDDRYILGAYTFYDRKKSSFSNFFNQLTIGAEFRSEKWVVCVNGYIPFGKTAVAEPAFNQCMLSPPDPNGIQNILFVNGKELALYGFDGEVGYSYKDLSVYVGGYYFNRNNARTVAGPRLRATYSLAGLFNILQRPFDDLLIEGSIHHDSPRGTQGYIGLRIFVYLGSTKERKTSGVHRRMLDYVRRDLDIVSAGNETAPFRTLTNANGSTTTVAKAADSAQLATAIGAADVVGVIEKVDVSNTLSMKDGQTITGGQYTFASDGEVHVLDVGQNGVLVVNDTSLANVTFPGGTVTEVEKDNTICFLTYEISTSNDTTAIGNANTSYGSFTIDHLTIDSTNSTSSNTGVKLDVNTGVNNFVGTDVEMKGVDVGYEGSFQTGVLEFSVEQKNWNIDAKNAAYKLENTSPLFGFASYSDSDYELSDVAVSKVVFEVDGAWDLDFRNVNYKIADGSDDSVGLKIKGTPGEETGVLGINNGAYSTGSGTGNNGIVIEANGGTVFVDSISNNNFSAIGNPANTFGITLNGNSGGEINVVQTQQEIDLQNANEGIQDLLETLGNVTYGF